jgi:hypothetical protein
MRAGCGTTWPIPPIQCGSATGLTGIIDASVSAPRRARRFVDRSKANHRRASGSLLE